MIKQSIGHEKEVYLKRRAKELNLVFKDEDQMRAEGETLVAAEEKRKKERKTGVFPCLACDAPCPTYGYGLSFPQS